ncbi:MAG: hypothetical protein WA667_25665 [Candidatus Nitrosopolaris sp.]
MHYKRQTAGLSVIFVLVGMVFLVSAITEKELASVAATAHTPICCFSSVKYHMYAGRFIVPPIVYPTKPDELIWLTIGSSSPFGGGDEKGYVAADAGPHHFPVKFNFFNPARGPNTCGVEPPHVGRCTISQGVHAGAQFFLDSLVPPSPALSDGNDGDANSDNEGDNSGDTP